MTNRLLRSAALALATVTSAAVLAACGGGDDAAQPAAAATTFNAADVSAADVSKDPQAVALAEDVATAQQAEAKKMQKLQAEVVERAMPGPR